MARENLHTVYVLDCGCAAIDADNLAGLTHSEASSAQTPGDSMRYWYELFGAVTETLVLNMAEWNDGIPGSSISDDMSKAHARVLAGVEELAHLHTLLKQDRRRSFQEATESGDGFTACL